LKWALAALVIASSARADDGFLHDLAHAARAKIDAAAAAHAPATVPPKRIEVHYRAQRIGSIDLGAPLIALAAADLDGDRKTELYAVTSREVIAIGVAPRIHELARAAFSGDPAVPRPRDDIGAAIVENGAVIASSSRWTRTLRVTWQGGALHADASDPAFALCPGERAQLAPGRNFFGAGATAYFGVRCAELVDAQGAPLHARAELSTGNKLAVTAGELHGEYPNAGVAFAVADLDRDGTPEVIFSAAGAPGDSDIVRIVALGDDIKHEKLKKTFVAGGVAAIAVGDLDGDGAPEVIAAVRLYGAPKVDLWRLN
jgi:hypothetical protein